MVCSQMVSMVQSIWLRHMAPSWESLRGCSTFLRKGEKIKAARWFQFNRFRTRDALSTASSLLLMITNIGMLGRLLGREKPSLMTIPPLVTRTKRTVDGLREAP